MKKPPIRVPLARGLFATVDANDGPVVAGCRWRPEPWPSDPNKFYARTELRRKTVRMHKLLWAAWGLYPVILDHINGDGLDNRRENLRPATQAQNLANAKLYRTSSTGLKGVRPVCNRWVARIGAERTHIGSFATKEEAAAAYVAAARKRYGEFAS